MVPQAQLQLVLPIDEFTSRAPSPIIARQRRVFCNRNLRMAGIGWVGFDMDYTLAIYRQREMDTLGVRATVEKLISRGYPPFLRDIVYATDFPVRGLLIDKRHGHILKMDRYKHVCKAFHGTRELSKDEIRSLYHAKKVRPGTPRYHWIDTLYALSEACIYAAMTEAMEKRGLAIDYARAFTDVRESIDGAHADGTVPNEVLGELPRYLVKDPELAPTLHKFRSAGKRLFLLTNSRWNYTNRVMSYLLNGAMSEYPTWRNYFDAVVVAACKPAFFQEYRPLRERDGEQLRPASFPLERGRIYEGGNVHDLERGLGTSGDQVLYVGDHIYGDILRSRKESVWNTAMIIQELETEIAAYEASRDDFQRVEAIAEAREGLEDELRYYQARFKELSRRLEQGASAHDVIGLETERARSKRAVERIRGRLKQHQVESELYERRIDGRFHPYWGSLLKEGDEQSSFGAQVEEYACVYTSRVSNFLAYSPAQFFRGPRDVMAHELGQ